MLLKKHARFSALHNLLNVRAKRYKTWNLLVRKHMVYSTIAANKHSKNTGGLVSAAVFYPEIYLSVLNFLKFSVAHCHSEQ